MRADAWGGVGFEQSAGRPDLQQGSSLADQGAGEPLGWTATHEAELGEAGSAAAAAAADRRTLQLPPSVPADLLPSPAALSPDAAALAAQAGAAVRLAAWLALLFAGYGFQRGLCAGGLPSDCGAVAGGDVYAALAALAFTGGALGVLAGVTRPARFAWLAAPRRLWLWLAHLALFPAYSALSNIPGLQESLATTHKWGPAMFAVTAVLGAAVVAALAFHLLLAWRTGGGGGGGGGSQSCTAPAAEPAASAAAADGGSGGSTPRSTCKHCRSAGSSLGSLTDAGSSSGDGSAQPMHARAHGAAGAAAGAPCGASLLWRRRARAARWRCVGSYLLPRLVVLAFFGAWLAALPASGAYSLHLHHYALGWAVAIFAAFNHPLSGLVLALATAVFVQGVGAYGFDPLLAKSSASQGGCLPVTSTTGQMTCSFWSDDPFSLRFCSDTPWIPWFNCSVPWPWPETDISRFQAPSLGGSGGGGLGGAAASPAAAPPPPWP